VGRRRARINQRCVDRIDPGGGVRSRTRVCPMRGTIANPRNKGGHRGTWQRQAATGVLPHRVPGLTAAVRARTSAETNEVTLPESRQRYSGPTIPTSEVPSALRRSSHVRCPARAGYTPGELALTLGTRLGPYEVTEQIGEGGMGQVYRAHDTKLNRDVAIKVLPESLAHVPDRLARFEREAQVLAALNHPNIAHIHGLEETNGHPALIMELVEGQTLAEQLVAGPLPPDEALPIARQIVEALEAAHASGIIHRDLKPANIKVRDDGTVKVLDFGLAKVFEQESAVRAGATISPTISMHATAAGLILGTAAYMSPEQARGRPVDRRADVWAFGAVLYEILTGRRAFDADDTSDTLALVLTRDPDWALLPASTPAAIRRLVRRCLEKDAKRRLPDIAVARLEIDEALATPIGDSAVIEARHAVGPHRGWRWMLPFGAGVLVSAVAVWSAMRGEPTPRALPVVRFGITLPPDGQLALSFNDRDLAVGANGTHLVYTAGGESQLMVRALDRLDPVPLAGVTNARAPFVSADARWVGFFDRLDEGLTTGPMLGGALKRVPIGGGPPTVIARVSGGSRGASWGQDDSIVFATSDRTTGLLRVAARGGEPEVLTRPDANKGERDHHFPSLLPDGRGVVFTIVGEANRRVAALDVKTGEWKTVLRSGSQAAYVETGHLVYVDGGALWAVRFDLATLETVGDSVPVLERVTWSNAAANVVLSREGTLVYAPSGGAGEVRSLVWVDRRGDESPIGAPPRSYLLPRLSPDGTRVAVSINDGRGVGFWIWDFALQKLTPLQSGSEPGGAFSLWSPDSRYLITGARNLFRQAVDGTGGEEQLTSDASPAAGQRRAVEISPDGTRLIYEQLGETASYDLMVLPLDGQSTPNGTGPDRASSPLLHTPSDERNASIAPDGRWLAYESNKTGRFQIYVKPFPNVNDAEHQISTAGGRTPVFARNGRELFFVSGSALMVTPVQLTPSFRAGNSTALFDARSVVLDARLIANTGRTYDVSRDATRFLMLKNDDAAAARMTGRPNMVVVQHWFQELTAKLPVVR
jgi:Tol biopolymer transport system component